MKYIAKTHIALSVPMAGGKSVHISFTPQTGGGSVFYTNDAALAQALEKHIKFGKLFKKVADAPAKIVTQPKEESTPQAKKPEKKEKVLTFACYEDAKDYLVDNFGISRTKLRTQTAIQAAAKANNITLQIDE